MSQAQNSGGDFDVVVTGGGPGGSTVSTLVAQKGYRVALFERAKFPRFHIGESLIPETYWVLQRLNMLPKMKKSQFVKKTSVQFVNQHGKLSEPFYFTDHNPHECSQTWQVLRSEFDQMMLDNAREHGVVQMIERREAHARSVLAGADSRVSAGSIIPRRCALAILAV
jgi:flavin-dependent dehydrogenase